MRVLFMQKTSSLVYATPFFFFVCQKNFDLNFFFCDWNRTFNNSLEFKTAFVNMKPQPTVGWQLIMDTVQSFVKWHR